MSRSGAFSLIAALSCFGVYFGNVTAGTAGIGIDHLALTAVPLFILITADYMTITSLGVGFITPPLGLNLFVVSGLNSEATLEITARAVPFVFFMLLVVLLIAYISGISTTMFPEILQ